jgi:hypothetical protein
MWLILDAERLPQLYLLVMHSGVKDIILNGNVRFIKVTFVLVLNIL